jgi:hypothetical protein
MSHIAKMCQKGMQKQDLTWADRVALAHLQQTLKDQAGKVWGPSATGGPGLWNRYEAMTTWEPAAFMNEPRERTTSGGMRLRTQRRVEYGK